MRSIVSIALAACAMTVISAPAFAQTPAPATPPAPPSAGGTPDAVPFDIPYGVSIGLERAKQVMAAAEAEAKKRGRKDHVEEEVRALPEVGPTAASALGLKEIRALIVGQISREECIAKIQQATRRYAKRQLTWFRHQTSFPQLNLTPFSHREAVRAITQMFRRAQE